MTEIFACYSIDEALVAPGTTAMLRAETLPTGRTLFDGPLPGIATGETQGFVQREADGVRLELTAQVPDPVIADRMVTVVQVVTVPFSEGRIIDVSLTIEEACLSTPCALGDTCVAGECRSEALAVRCLRRHGDEPSPDCDDLRGLRVCAEL